MSGVREEELPDRRIEREAVRALAGREHEDRRWAVEHVARRGDLATRTQRIGEARPRELRLLAAKDREDGPDADVRIDVARAVERIEQHDILAVVIGAGRLFELLAPDDAAVAAALEDVDEHVVAERVELLDLLALHVDLAGVPEQIGQTGGTDARVDDADGERDVVEERRELPGRPDRRVHPVQDVLAQCGPHDGSRVRSALGRDAVGHGITAGFPRCEAPPQATGTTNARASAVRHDLYGARGPPLTEEMRCRYAARPENPRPSEPSRLEEHETWPRPTA